MKKLFHFIAAVLIIILFSAAIFFLALTFFKKDTPPTILGYSFYQIEIEGVKNLSKGDLIIAQSPHHISPVIGNVIIYLDENNGFQIGEVVQIDNNEIFTVTGSQQDLAVYSGQIVGVMEYYSPFLGQGISFAVSSQGMLAIVILPSLGLLVLEIIRLSKGKEKTSELLETVDSDVETIPLPIPSLKKKSPQSIDEVLFSPDRVQQKQKELVIPPVDDSKVETPTKPHTSSQDEIDIEDILASFSKNKI